MATRKDLTEQGKEAYQSWRRELREHPDFERIYEEEAAKGDLWLRLVEAREAAGLTQAEVAQRLGVSQAQVARIEKQGYDLCSLSALRRYLKALGDDYQLEVKVLHPSRTHST